MSGNVQGLKEAVDSPRDGCAIASRQPGPFDRPLASGVLTVQIIRLLDGVMQDIKPLEGADKKVATPVLVSSIVAATEDREQELVAAASKVISLIAGFDSLLRRTADIHNLVLRVGPLELDLLERSARRGDRAINLLPREFRLLEYMMRRKDQTTTRATLLKEVWNYKFVPETNLVDVHIGRLRRKIDLPHEQPIICSVRGVGFVLRAPA
jgi:two-component system OmpR family response regulator